MAYLNPQTLRCPNCDYETKITTVVGVGPNSRKGDIPYQHHLRSDTGLSGPQITCPNDGTVLWSDKAGQKA